MELITPIPQPGKHRGAGRRSLVFDEGKGRSSQVQQYDPTPVFNALRLHVDARHSLPNPALWPVTREAARLLHHRHHHTFNGIRPCFCRVEVSVTGISKKNG